MRLDRSVPEYGMYDESDLDDLLDVRYDWEETDDRETDRDWLRSLPLGVIHNWGHLRIMRVETQEPMETGELAYVPK